MAVTPYRPKLKRVSRKRLALLEAIYAYLPEGELREQVIVGIRGALAGELGEGFDLRLETVRQETMETFVAKLPQHPVAMFLRVEPHDERLILEIDPMLGIMAVEKMLGGHIESIPEIRALSETEQGVLEYLIAKALASIHERCGRNARVHLRFDRFAESHDPIRKLAEADAEVAVLTFRATLGRHAGFVRLAFTDPFVEQALQGTGSAEGATPRERAILRERLARFAFVKVPLWVEAGGTVLLPADLRQLEEGDVILFEKGDLRLSEAAGSGNAILRVGEGLRAGVEVEVELTKTRAKCRMQGVHKGA
jgi:flagellar motor switch protein FliM